MRKWEYYWMPFDFDVEEMNKIDALGKEGWELVAIVPVREGCLKYTAVLKRGWSFLFPTKEEK